MAEEKAMRVIKRYANRKLYDMSESCYITHDEIAALVERGEEIRIIDNRTKEDLTTATLTQILFEKERKIQRTLPLDTLRNFFQQGGEFIQRHITQPVTNLKGEAERKLPKVFRARDKDKEREEEPTAEPPPSAPEDSLAGIKAKRAEALGEWVTGTQQALQKNVEERWNDVVGYLGQFDVNHRRIAELEHRVEVLEAVVAKLSGVEPPAAGDG